jgi:transposase
MATYSPADYELLRRRCAALKEQNWPQVKIAQALGMTEGWVSQTLKKYRQDGPEALVWKKPAGPLCRLDEQQLAQLVTELNKGAVAHGFEGQVWTRQRVNAVITKLFGVSYDPSQVGRLLKRVGWSRQKPQPKARQQDAAAVQQWREDHLPALKKSAG